jgi:hypothetical protein
MIFQLLLFTCIENYLIRVELIILQPVQRSILANSREWNSDYAHQTHFPAQDSTSYQQDLLICQDNTVPRISSNGNQHIPVRDVILADLDLVLR